MEQAASFFDNGLVDRLPDVRGKLTPNGALAEQSWFRVGGPAEVLFRPADVDDLVFFLERCPPDVPVTVLGAASNVLIRDGGIPGVVIRFSPSFSSVQAVEGGLEVGAGAVDLNVARAAMDAGLAGMEFLSGIPGTIGGGLRMNAGAYGSEFQNIVFRADVVHRDGSRKTLHADGIGFSYRATKVSPDTIFVSTLLLGEEDDPRLIAERMKVIREKRRATQPIGERTCGSTFANPLEDPEGRKSWQLIEAAGCRGLKMGHAKVSDKHCNFLINTGRATAEEIEALGEEVQKRVFDQFGVKLRWEIKRIGIKKV